MRSHNNNMPYKEETSNLNSELLNIIRFLEDNSSMATLTLTKTLYNNCSKQYNANQLLRYFRHTNHLN